MTKDPDYDLVIIGGGPGGVAAAKSAALRGKNVALISAQDLMGYGLEGAYKSKAMYEIAKEYLSVRTRWGLETASHNKGYKSVFKTTQTGCKRLRRVHSNRLRSLGIDLYNGWGRFLDDRTVAVGEDTLTFTNAIIATGTSPRVLRGMDPDGIHILTSDHIVNYSRPIDSMLVLGAGVIGCEFASIFAALGVKVTLIDTQPRIFNHDDEDLSILISQTMERLEVEVKASSRVNEMRLEDGKVVNVLADGTELRTDASLLAVGRVANTNSLDLSAAGVETNKWGYVPTNDKMATNIPHIYAIGDVGLRNTEHDLSLVHVAEAEGRVAVHNICGTTEELDTTHVPFIIFTLPMVAGAGMNETQARAAFGDDVRVAKFAHVRNHRAHTRNVLEGFVKLIVGPPGNDRVLGARGIGDGVDGVMGEVSIMIQHGLPYTHLLDSIHAHPSISESLQGAAFMISGDKPGYEEGEEFGLELLRDSMMMPKITG